MNTSCEQITLDKSLVVAVDQPLRGMRLMDCLINALGADNCRIISMPPRKLVLEYTKDGRTCHLLAKSCTYLGWPHPVCKKRMQLSPWFNDYARSNPGIDVRYIGVYHYGDDVHGENVIFIDFKKDTYLAKKGNNSSAHICTNDLFQAMTYGIFSKTDRMGNYLTAIRQDKFAEYLSGQASDSNSPFGLFREFNCGFPFGEWISALNAITEMHTNNWRQWRQAEWAGWLLEYKFHKFTIERDITDKMRYVGCSLKRDGDLDFDVRFEEANFYGDLKASDAGKKETPGNVQHNLIEYIYKFDKFWYIIYEHETVKDDPATGYEATRARNVYIKSVDPAYGKGELSYHQRMKSRVRFTKMSIIELNRVNFREALKDFNQGRQPDGKARKPKFNINKEVLENDNFVVFRYNYNQ